MSDEPAVSVSGQPAVLDEPGQTPSPPPSVIAAIALGLAPLPFLAIYAGLFLTHGLLFPVTPPDITGSRRGETLAGVIALILLGIGILTTWLLLSGRRRWPLILVQLATLATAIDFITDPNTGTIGVPVVLAATSAVATAAAFAPATARFVGSTGVPGLTTFVRRRRPGWDRIEPE